MSTNGKQAAAAYPLAWPEGWKRTIPAYRKRARFTKGEWVNPSGNPGGGYKRQREITVYDAVTRVREELERLGAEAHYVVISTDVPTRNDGFPRSGSREPDDPGAAVYWRDPDTDEQSCMAIDIYDKVAGNLAAIAASIEALRAIERHGGAAILKRAFQGFKALPPGSEAASQRMTAAEARALLARLVNIEPDALKFSNVLAMVARQARAKAHPDAGGTDEQFQQVQEAISILEAEQ